MLLHTQTKHNVNNMYFYCNNCPNFIRGQNYYCISKANYWVSTIVVTCQLTEAVPPIVLNCGLQMDNNQQKRVVVFIRRLGGPAQEGSIHVKPNDMDVYSGFRECGKYLPKIH